MDTLRGIGLLVILVFCGWALGGEPATQPVGHLPHIAVDVTHREVRVECTSVKADYPLEFLVVAPETNEYEAVASSRAKPSDLHLALLMLGLKPGEPVHYSETLKEWIPPAGPGVQIRFSYLQAGKLTTVGANEWLRDVKTHEAAPPMTWVFTGSRTLDDGTFMANAAGHLVAVINNEASVLDVPAIKATALESRQWERNPSSMPPTGTAVMMILTPADASTSTTQATQPDVHP